MGIAISLTCDMDKLVIVHDSNRIAVMDIVNKKIHDWTRR